MSHLEVIARMRIRPGQLEGFKRQAAELMRVTREEDTQTLRYDWFIDEDAMECQVHEAYLTEDGMFEHNMHILDVRNVLFRDFATGHDMSAYGEISQRLKDLGEKHAGGIHHYSFLAGLEPTPTV